MATTYANYSPALPDEDHELFLCAIRLTTESAQHFCAVLKDHLEAAGLADPYEMYIFSEGDEDGSEGPSAIWIRSRVRG